MIFPYQSMISESPDGVDYVLFLRPEIPATIIGPAGSETFFGLVDTGSDNTILPKSIADQLGIPLRAASGPPAIVFGGRSLRMLIGEVGFALTSENETYRWAATVQFFEFESPEEETVVLGHSGFLDYFTAIFDGKEGLLTLQANDLLPVVE